MAFSGAFLDHCDNDRTGPLIQSALREPAARCVVFHNYRPAFDHDGTLLKAHPSELAGRDLWDPAIIFLGRDAATRRPWFAAHLKSPDNLADPDDFHDLRNAAGLMDSQDLAIVGRAQALIDWHGSHGFCAKCGTRSLPSKGAAVRQCTACGTEHFPRVNPVAIMLVTHENNLLLGRQPGWPPGAFSCLAGFASPGEDLEEACIREVKEEVGLHVTDVRYLMSQSWPFPSQLMLGLQCEAKSTELTIDPNELETARWFTRAEVEAVFSKTGPEEERAFRRPPAFTIAHQLIRAWLENGARD